MSNDLWFSGKKFEEEEDKRQNAKEMNAHLEAMVLRTKREAKKRLHLIPRVATLGMEAFERDPRMIAKIHAYLVGELNLAQR